MQWVVCYDISDDRRRRQVIKLLRSYGYRVQESVFHCLLRNPADVEILLKNLRQVINEGQDLCHMYRLAPIAAERFYQLGACQYQEPAQVVVC